MVSMKYHRRKLFEKRNFLSPQVPIPIIVSISMRDALRSPRQISCTQQRRHIRSWNSMGTKKNFSAKCRNDDIISFDGIVVVVVVVVAADKQVISQSVACVIHVPFTFHSKRTNSPSSVVINADKQYWLHQWTNKSSKNSFEKILIFSLFKQFPSVVTAIHLIYDCGMVVLRHKFQDLIGSNGAATTTTTRVVR